MLFLPRRKNFKKSLNTLWICHHVEAQGFLLKDTSNSLNTLWICHHVEAQGFLLEDTSILHKIQPNLDLIQFIWIFFRVSECLYFMLNIFIIVNFTLKSM